LSSYNEGVLRDTESFRETIFGIIRELSCIISARDAKYLRNEKKRWIPRNAFETEDMD